MAELVQTIAVLDKTGKAVTSVSSDCTLNIPSICNANLPYRTSTLSVYGKRQKLRIRTGRPKCLQSDKMGQASVAAEGVNEAH